MKYEYLPQTSFPIYFYSWCPEQKHVHTHYTVTSQKSDALRKSLTNCSSTQLLCHSCRVNVSLKLQTSCGCEHSTWICAKKHLGFCMYCNQVRTTAAVPSTQPGMITELPESGKRMGEKKKNQRNPDKFSRSKNIMIYGKIWTKQSLHKYKRMLSVSSSLEGLEEWKLPDILWSLWYRSAMQRYPVAQTQ